MAVFDPFNPLKNVTPRFTEEQLTEIIEFFDAHAKPLLVINEGEPINVISIETFIEYLGLKKYHKRHFSYPSYKELMTEAEKLHAGITRLLTIDQCIYILNTRVLEPDLKHELLLAFQVFDTEKKNFLELGEIETIVTAYGEAFNQAETIEILRDVNVRGDGNVVYENFVESLFDLAPELYEIQAEFLYTDPNEDPSVPPDPEPEPEPEVPPPPPPPPPPPKKRPKKKK